MDHEHVQIFYCFNLLQQMFPAGIAEVNFLSYFANTTKKQKESPHSFFTNVSSLFFDTKKEHLNDLDTLNLYFFNNFILSYFCSKVNAFYQKNKIIFEVYAFPTMNNKRIWI